MIGIIGGMGPKATVDLYNHIIRLSNAREEQDHVPALIYSNPRIPDRTMNAETAERQVIIKGLREMARVLERAGADVLAMPCNSAHLFYESIVDAVSIPVINMIEESVAYIVNNKSCSEGVGLLCTLATYKSGMYQRPLEDRGIPVVLPNDKLRNRVMDIVYDIKNGGDLAEAGNNLLEVVEGWHVPVVVGCTEIALALKDTERHILVNPTEILAMAALIRNTDAEAGLASPDLTRIQSSSLLDINVAS